MRINFNNIFCSVIYSVASLITAEQNMYEYVAVLTHKIA